MYRETSNWRYRCKRLDDQNDDYITQVAPTDEQWYTLFQEYDLNNDNNISQTEIELFMMQH